MKPEVGSMVSVEQDIPSRISSYPGALTVAELAPLLGLGRTTLYEMAKAGSLPHYRIAGVLRFDPALVAKWLRSQAVEFFDPAGIRPRVNAKRTSAKKRREL